MHSLAHMAKNPYKKICSAVSNEMKIPLNSVVTASTGVIGEKLPHEKNNF